MPRRFSVWAVYFQAPCADEISDTLELGTPSKWIRQINLRLPIRSFGALARVCVCARAPGRLKRVIRVARSDTMPRYSDAARCTRIRIQ